MAALLRREHGPVSVGMVGYQPGLLRGLVRSFGAANVVVTDLDPDNLGRVIDGVEVWNGDTHACDLVERSDLLLATGSTAANGTLDQLVALARARGKPLVLFGVTAAAIAHLCGLQRLCVRGG